jgi:UDP-N-acetyl-D-mannosaminuronic acid dehydrogenase
MVLGLTYREGVRELAYSRAIPLMERLRFHGAEVWAWDPLLAGEEIERLGARPYRWGEQSAVEAIVVQTADEAFRELTPAWFPALRVLFDGRNRLSELTLPEGVHYVGVGRPSRRDAPARTRRLPVAGPSGSA